MTSYAYIHCKPDGTPFYVGKGALRRAKYLGERNPYHQATVKKYGKENILIGMLECSSSAIALRLEVGIIKCMKRMSVKLTNLTNGGEGTVNPCEESRKRMSEAAKKRGVSEACKVAKVAALKGKKLTEEHKKKLSTSNTGKVFTEEHRNNISIGAKKRGISKHVRNAQINAVSKKVKGEHQIFGIMYWDSAKIAAEFLRGNRVTVTRRIKNNSEFLGWKLEYLK